MRIGVIGSGGAGTTAAWLLDEHHEVTLFERGSVLGGHAHTTDVQLSDRRYSCDDGFAWFSNQMYPLLLNLCAVHGIETEAVPMGITFTNRMAGQSVCMPPVNPSQIWQLLRDPKRIRYLLGFNHALSRGWTTVEQRDASMTLAEFVQSLDLDPEVREAFVQPFLFGVWGGPWDRSGDFAAYPVLKYPVLHRPTQLRRVTWLQMTQGTRRYIETVVASLQQTHVLLDTAVEAVGRDNGTWVVRDSHGQQHHFDRLVLATGSYDARKILADVAGFDALRAVLDRFETYVATIATHQDPSVMPPLRSDWKPVHVDFDGTSARQTSWVGWREQLPVFTSYVQPDQALDKVANISRFRLPMVTPQHFSAQEQLAPLQGTQGLHLCGDWTQDIGSHEDAVRSALHAAVAIGGLGQRYEALVSGTSEADRLSRAS